MQIPPTMKYYTQNVLKVNIKMNKSAHYTTSVSTFCAKYFKKTVDIRTNRAIIILNSTNRAELQKKE